MYQGLDEQELARRCLSGDNLAEDELYTRYAARLFSLCRRYCSNADDAKDLMQDALIRCLEKMDTFKYAGKGSLYAWISRIAVNMALHNLRRRRIPTISLDFQARDNIPDPSDEEISRIPEDVLLGMISRLPEMRRAVFNLYCIEGCSHKEISTILGISEKGTTSALTKARAQLKKEINRYLKDTE